MPPVIMSVEMRLITAFIVGIPVVALLDIAPNDYNSLFIVYCTAIIGAVLAGLGTGLLIVRRRRR